MEASCDVLPGSKMSKVPKTLQKLQSFVLLPFVRIP
ncbi:Protein of unknown function [Pyronema omphalodes CBS 100304]|uniref:Uncharacterized protein n=1 Tax=Pyronema omphalodes (strain CBS 100304) TaxID=1076935 RepID=U4L4K4_PYROM|nr:Protein of unknown function [Pyronema omphalodes CBS 100304]